MKIALDLNTWDRKEHFFFFKDFDEPFYGFTVTIDCHKAYLASKSNNQSFFLTYVFKLLQAANHFPEFKYVIEEDQVFEYQQINIALTLQRKDGTFGFGHFKFHENESQFIDDALIEIDRVKHSNSILPTNLEPNQIHFSAIPWISFTALSHARPFSRPDSSPKISIGKIIKNQQGRFEFPLSIHVHHALMDGFHVGLFLDYFQKLMDL